MEAPTTTELDERLFWDEARDSFERLAADPVALAKYRAEVELWELGTAKDFAGEEW